jgi:hypothetical protein
VCRLRAFFVCQTVNSLQIAAYAGMFDHSGRHRRPHQGRSFCKNLTVLARFCQLCNGGESIDDRRGGYKRDCVGDFCLLCCYFEGIITVLPSHGNLIGSFLPSNTARRSARNVTAALTASSRKLSQSSLARRLSVSIGGALSILWTVGVSGSIRYASHERYTDNRRRSSGPHHRTSPDTGPPSPLARRASRYRLD